MLELKNAYEILGLKENASREELEKRFEFLIRKGKAAAMLEQSLEENQGLNMDEISEAYNRIISNDLETLEREEEKRNPRKPNPLFKLVGVDEKKARNYIHYHKFHYIFGLIGLLLVIYFVKTIVFQVRPDVNVAFIGQIYYSDSNIIENKIKESYTDLKAISIDSVMLTGDPKNQQESAMLQKAMVLMAAGDIDIFVLDKANFDKYAEQGVFMNLDDLVVKLGIDKSKYQDYVLKPKDEQKEHFYGIDINSSSILKLCQVAGNEKIATIRVNAKHYEKAVKILELLLK